MMKKEQNDRVRINPKNPDLSFLAAKWPSQIVSRDQVSLFTGGLISPKTMANLDSLGEGPEGRVRIGKKIGYLLDIFIRWLESRATIEG